MAFLTLQYHISIRAEFCRGSRLLMSNCSLPRGGSWFSIIANPRPSVCKSHCPALIGPWSPSWPPIGPYVSPRPWWEDGPGCPMPSPPTRCSHSTFSVFPPAPRQLSSSRELFILGVDISSPLSQWPCEGICHHPMMCTSQYRHCIPG